MPDASRVDIIKAWIAEGKTLAEVGNLLGGLTRERIRQILRDECGLSVFDLRTRIKVSKFPISGFYTAMRRWLYAAGYMYCWNCRQWLPKEGNFLKSGGNVCRPCRSARAKIRYREDAKYRQYILKYSRTPESRARQKKCTAKWQKEHPGYGVQRRKERYHTDPEYRARIIRYRIEWERRRREDPEYLERSRARSRERYAKKKAEKEKGGAL